MQFCFVIIVQLEVPNALDLFGFLLTENRPQDSLPPGFTGCINNIIIDENPLIFNSETVVEEVLDGYCAN